MGQDAVLGEAVVNLKIDEGGEATNLSCSAESVIVLSQAVSNESDYQAYKHMALEKKTITMLAEHD